MGRKVRSESWLLGLCSAVREVKRGVSVGRKVCSESWLPGTFEGSEFRLLELDLSVGCCIRSGTGKVGTTLDSWLLGMGVCASFNGAILVALVQQPPIL